MAKLPAVPIPTFTEKLGNSATSGRCSKFIYLNNALREEVRDLIRPHSLPIEPNYDHAIDLLKAKHGNETAFIGDLQSRLEIAKAES